MGFPHPVSHPHADAWPMQGNFAGITSGPNGEPLVVGLVFSDSEVDRLESFYRRKRAVLLGTRLLYFRGPTTFTTTRGRTRYRWWQG